MNDVPLKRVLFLIDQLDGITAGTENQLITLIKGLGETEFQPFLMVLRETDYVRNNRLPCSCTVLGVKKLLSPAAIIGGIKLVAFLLRNSISIVHIFFNDSSIIAPVFCKLAGSKVIVSRRDTGFNLSPKEVFFLRTNRRFLDMMIANSNAAREKIRENEKWPPDLRFDVIPNGHPQSRFLNQETSDFRQRFGIPPKAPVIGMVANLHPYKRHRDLLDSFRIVHSSYPESYLVIVGDGICRNDLKSMSCSLGIAEFVHFSGSLENVIPMVREFSVGVLCSETEGFSNAILEYMGCGVPLVATMTGGNPEIVEEGVNGFLVPVGDCEAIADRICKILENQKLGIRLGEEGRRKVFTQYDLKKMVNSYVSTYEDLLT